MRLLVANANTTQAITTLCADAARIAAAPGTEIIPATPASAPR
jgi:allantoin racemase